MIEVDYLRARLGGGLGKGSTADDTVLAELEAGVVSFVEGATGRSFDESASVTEIYDGTGEQVIELRAPVASGTPTVYYRSGSSWTEVAGSQWYVDTHPQLQIDNLLVLYAYKWPWGERNVKVVYDGGYTAGDEPAEIRGLVAELTTIRFRNRVVGASLGDATDRPDDLPEHLGRVLDRWRMIPRSPQPRLVKA